MVLALLAAGLVFCGTAAASFVPATSPRIKTMGRWIPADNGSLYAGRGGVLASTKFEGTGVQVQMYRKDHMGRETGKKGGTDGKPRPLLLLTV